MQSMMPYPSQIPNVQLMASANVIGRQIVANMRKAAAVHVMAIGAVTLL